MSYIGVSASPTPAGVYTKAESETRLATRLSTEGGEITGGLTVNPPIGESFVKLKSNTVGATSEVMLRGSDNDGFDTAYNSTLDQFRISRYVNNVYQNSPLAIDSAGRVTMPYQPHYVAYARASNFNTNGETNYTTFVHRDTRINTGNHMNTSTGKFTCPVAGRYLVSFQGLCRGAGSFNLAIVLNGAQYNQLGRAIVASGTEQNVKTFAIVPCAANDELRIDCSTSVSGDIYFEHNSTSIVLIG